MRTVLAVAAALTALATAQAQAPAQAEPPGLSEAERLVFTAPHLAGMKPPLNLRYTYVRDRPAQGRVSDVVTMQFAAGTGGGCCTVQGQFLSGEEAVNLPEIPDATSNPVLMYFLEHEVRQMQRTTRGAAAHFRKRIRQALVDAASVTGTTVRWGAKDVPAREIRITPYRDDPYRQRFEQQAATEYRFVLSDAVPGGVYQVLATVPVAGSDAAPVFHQSLTLEDPQTAETPKR